MLFLKLIIITIWFSSTLSYIEIPESKIIGGKDAKIEEIPWQISLRIRGEHYCGGSIITAKSILTAAHCVTDRKKSDLSVLAGTDNRLEGGVIKKLESIIIHQDFDKSVDLDCDLAVLIVDTDFVFSEKIQPINLAPKDYIYKPGTIATISGWGILDGKKTRSDILQMIKIPVVPMEDCKKFYGTEHTTTNMLCAGLSGGEMSTAYGDSGGPLFVDRLLIGTSSHGKNRLTDRNPRIYAKISAMREWIDLVKVD